MTYEQLPSSWVSLSNWNQTAQAERPELLDAKLLTPLGQFVWALGQVTICAPGERVARIRNLRHFASLHWQGWYDVAVVALQDAAALDDAEVFGSIVARLTGAAGRVAVYECFRPLFHGAVRDLANSGPAQTKAQLWYCLTEPLEHRPAALEDLQTDIADDQWWLELATQIGRVQAALDAVAAGGFDPVEVLDGALSAITQNIERFSIIADGLLVDLKLTEPLLREAYDCLETVLKEMGEIEAEAGTLRAELSRGRG